MVAFCCPRRAFIAGWGYRCTDSVFAAGFLRVCYGRVPFRRGCFHLTRLGHEGLHGLHPAVKFTVWQHGFDSHKLTVHPLFKR